MFLLIKTKKFNIRNKKEKVRYKKIKNYKADVIFNALHGRDGEDGVAQSYFEYFKIPQVIQALLMLSYYTGFLQCCEINAVS